MLVKPGGNKIPAHCKKVSAPDLNDILPNLIYMREIYFRRTVEILAGGVVNSIGNSHLIRHSEVSQLVVYKGKDGRARFTDTGPRIVMHDKGADSLEAALRIAAQKYGGKVDITGSSEFRDRAARQATRLGIQVLNEDLQGIVQNEVAENRRRNEPKQEHDTRGKGF